MSWSVSAIGKPAAVAEALAGQFSRIPLMQEPEETGKNCAAAAVAAIVPVYPPSYVVQVNCSGSQNTPNSSKYPDQKVNNFTVSIQTLGPILE